MSRLPRATFALMLALLPATATVVGAIVLLQIPSLRDIFGIALVMAGVALHKQPAAARAGMIVTPDWRGLSDYRKEEKANGIEG